MTTATARRPLPPATGTCRWLADAPNGDPRLEINGTAYEVEAVPGGFALYRLDEKEGVIRYEIDCTFGYGVWRCSCPDAANRPERRFACKHVQSLKAAFKALPF